MIGILYFYLDWGFTGVCWATGFMFLFRCCMNVVQVEFGSQIKKQEGVYLFSRETVSNIGPLISICSK